MSNWQSNLSYITTHTRPSPLGDLLALTKSPDIITFAVGSPAAEVFPLDKFYESAHLLKDHGTDLLQYGTTEGNVELRDFLTDFCAERLGRKAGMDEIILTTGSQQALDLFSWSLLNPGDVVLCEDPSYMAALTVFCNHRAVPRGIPCDEDGMLVDQIPAFIESLRAEGKTLKFVYTVVNFQNPGGMTMSIERRKKLAALAEEYDFLIMEDDPYGFVRYDGEHLPSIFSFDKAGRTLYSGSFSKIFAPGSRTGWVIGDPKIIRTMCVFKQSTDVCSSSIDQALLAEYCRKGYLEEHLPNIISNYRVRRDAMDAGFRKYLSPLGVTWVKPKGGFFFWINFPGIDGQELSMRAVSKKVAVIPGNAFGIEEGSGKCNARVNFTFCPLDLMDEGIRRLASALSELQAEASIRA